MPACEEPGIPQVVFSPVAQGVLTGKYQSGAQPPEGGRARDENGGADMVKRYLRDDVLQAVQRLKPVADDAGLSLAQLAGAGVLQNPNVASALMGASRPGQVAENVRAVGVRLGNDARQAIDTALGDLPETDPTQTRSPDQRPA